MTARDAASRRGAMRTRDFGDVHGAFRVLGIDGAAGHLRLAHLDEEAARGRFDAAAEVLGGGGVAGGLRVLFALVGDGELEHLIREGARAVGAEEVNEHAPELEEEFAGVVGVIGEDVFAEPAQGGLEADFVDGAGFDAVIDGEADVLRVVLRGVTDAVQRGLGEAGDGGFHDGDLFHDGG
jgi:hypothetical protein